MPESVILSPIWPHKLVNIVSLSSPGAWQWTPHNMALHCVLRDKSLEGMYVCTYVTGPITVDA